MDRFWSETPQSLPFDTQKAFRVEIPNFKRYLYIKKHQIYPQPQQSYGTTGENRGAGWGKNTGKWGRFHQFHPQNTTIFTLLYVKTKKIPGNWNEPKQTIWRGIPQWDLSETRNHEAVKKAATSDLTTIKSRVWKNSVQIFTEFQLLFLKWALCRT